MLLEKNFTERETSAGYYNFIAIKKSIFNLYNKARHYKKPVRITKS